MRTLQFAIITVAVSAASCAPTRNADLLLSAPAITAAAAPREQTADQQVKHALSRLTFGARPGDAERVRVMGVDRWIAEQLRPERIDDGATERWLARFPTLALSTSDLYRQYPPPQALLAERRAEMARAGVMPATADSAEDRRGMVLLTRDDSAAFRRAARRSQQVYGEVQAARVARAVTTERQLEEVMADFWLNHFSVFAGKGQMRYMLGEYEREAVRPHALGKFRELVGAVANSPAMLFYLDNWQSVADSGRPVLVPARQGSGARRTDGAIGPRRRDRVLRGGPLVPPAGAMNRSDPGRDWLAARLQQRRRRGLNENYARELLELHTLGVDGGYTQQDVIEVARAFTGWSIEDPRRSADFVFRPQAHDAGQKRVLGNALPAGRGIEDGEQVLDIVARHPATARFIASKLARRFVSDSPPPALVERAAATFARTDGNIGEVVRTIITSPEFFSSAAYRAKVKSPFELVVSALRAVGARPDSTPRTAQIIARLGQPIYGHQAPNGYPETGSAWINTGALLNRINFGLAVAAGRVPGVTLDGWPEGAKLASGARDEQVDGVIAALLGGEASPDTRKVLESGTNPLLARAGNVIDSTAAHVGADPEIAAEPVDMMMLSPDAARPRGRPGRRRADPLGAPAPLDGFAQIVGLALGAPEFQRK
ncbi:MAG: DUF1800 domain-containing protein [Gemmatimonadota bacterium]|nr:DUF1800 domain-containing protein [Gemmatimonadota bacterium]